MAPDDFNGPLDNPDRDAKPRCTQVETLCIREAHRLTTCATGGSEGRDAKREGTQVENLCYGGQRGAARAREPALLTERSHDGESEGSIERAKASV